MYGVEYKLQCIGNNGGNVGILQSLLQVDPTNAHRGKIKNTICKICWDLPNQYEVEGDSFLECIITGDKTWCPHYELESKWQSMEWQYVNSPLKKKFKMLPSECKVMCTVFWDRKGVILLVFLEPGQTINSDHYIAMLS